MACHSLGCVLACVTQVLVSRKRTEYSWGWFEFIVWSLKPGYVGLRACVKCLDYKAELKKLNLSLLFNHYDLVSVLVENPDKSTEVQDQILKIYLNFHHLLNSLRPQQARETLITTMDEQIERRKKFLEELTKYDILLFNLAHIQGRRKIQNTTCESQGWTFESRITTSRIDHDPVT